MNSFRSDSLHPGPRTQLMLRRAVCSLVLWVSSDAGAANLMVNGTFTGGFTGWGLTGSPFNTGDTLVFSDSSSPAVTLIQTAALPPGIRAWTVSFDLLNGLAQRVTEGFQPDVVFATLYLGAQPFGPELRSGLFDQVLPLFDLNASGSLGMVSGGSFSPSPKGPGWQRFQAAVSGPVNSAFLTLAFEFYDLNGAAADSVAAFDNIEVLQIPEPGTVSLILVSTAGLFLCRRRRGILPLFCKPS